MAQLERNLDSYIYTIRFQKVMLDSDLADLYEIKTHVSNQAIKRNLSRFPADFMFQLTREEFQKICEGKSSISSHGGRRKLPYVFSEHGVAMLSSILKSEKAIKINIEIIRSFVKLRQLATENQSLISKINELEERYDENFKIIFDALRNHLIPSLKKDRRKIGF